MISGFDIRYVFRPAYIFSILTNKWYVTNGVWDIVSNCFVDGLGNPCDEFEYTYYNGKTVVMKLLLSIPEGETIDDKTTDSPLLPEMKIWIKLLNDEHDKYLYALRLLHFNLEYEDELIQTVGLMNKERLDEWKQLRNLVQQQYMQIPITR